MTQQSARRRGPRRPQALPPPAGALPPPTGMLAKLKELDLKRTRVTDAGCAALTSALDSGGLTALEKLDLTGTSASAGRRKLPCT